MTYRVEVHATHAATRERRLVEAMWSDSYPALRALVAERGYALRWPVWLDGDERWLVSDMQWRRVS